MTTAAQVQAAWKTYIFDATSIKDIAINAYPYPVTQMSEVEAAKFYQSGEINCFTYLVTTAQERKNSATVQRHFYVDITYYREQDTKGDNWTAVRNAFETIHALAISALGAKWNETVDYWNTTAEAPSISADTLDNRPIWRGEYRFTAEQYN